jgi:hypothetical protein
MAVMSSSRLAAAILLASAGMARASSGLDGMDAVALWLVAAMLNGVLLLGALLGGTRHLAWRLAVLAVSVVLLFIFGSRSRLEPALALATVMAPVIGIGVLFTLPGVESGSDG